MVTICDHIPEIQTLWFHALGFHGARSAHGCAFVRLREHMAANAAILRRLAEIDKTLLEHDAALRNVYRKLQMLLAPPPETPKRRIGF